MIGLDGIIFSLQRQGGISVYFRELLTALSAREVLAMLYLEEPMQAVPPQSDRYQQQVRRRARWLERYRSCRLGREVSLYHSSYYRLPEDSHVPTIVTVHDFIYERYATGARRAVHMQQKHRAIRAAQTVICVSEATRQDFFRYVGERPGQAVHVIHNGVSESYRPLGGGVIKPYLLFVGARGGYKHFDLATQAMALLPDFELHCVGGGAFGPRELAGVPESVRGRIRHHGYVGEEQLNHLYNRAFCLIYPSSYEGFGIPVLEAMRAGCPVVCRDCQAVLEVGGDALTVALARDATALAEAVRRLSDAGYRGSRVRRGLELAAGYSWAATHDRTLRLYQEWGIQIQDGYSA